MTKRRLRTIFFFLTKSGNIPLVSLCRECLGITSSNLKVVQWLKKKKIHLPSRRCSFNPWVGKIPWRREWKPTPVLLLGESHGQRSLAGYSPWGCKELAMTEWPNSITSKETLPKLTVPMATFNSGKGHYIKLGLSKSTSLEGLW